MERCKFLFKDVVYTTIIASGKTFEDCQVNAIRRKQGKTPPGAFVYDLRIDKPNQIMLSTPITPQQFAVLVAPTRRLKNKTKRKPQAKTKAKP